MADLFDDLSDWDDVDFDAVEEQVKSAKRKSDLEGERRKVEQPEKKRPRSGMLSPSGNASSSGHTLSGGVARGSADGSAIRVESVDYFDDMDDFADVDLDSIERKAILSRDSASHEPNSKSTTSETTKVQTHSKENSS